MGYYKNRVDVEWNHPTQDRNQGPAILNMLINIRSYKKEFFA
jgi:hypothetical protein